MSALSLVLGQAHIAPCSSEEAPIHRQLPSCQSSPPRPPRPRLLVLESPRREFAGSRAQAAAEPDRVIQGT